MDDTTEFRKFTRNELAAQILRDSGKLRFRATGSSMLPEIRPGDVLMVHRRGISEIQPGDIVFFSCYGGVVAHRVKFASPDHLTAQGDTAHSADPAVTAENILGLVVSIERDSHSFVPSRRLGLLSRVTSAVLRRSDFAMRIWLAGWIRIRSLRNSSKPQLHTVSSSLTTPL
ncbi:MAG: S24/S26 family peptidase [Acidobacteriota bacterium]|nr:S24/S26 family peptidase [Acidobacteriota bacterium]